MAPPLQLSHQSHQSFHHSGCNEKCYRFFNGQWKQAVTTDRLELTRWPEYQNVSPHRNCPRFVMESNLFSDLQSPLHSNLCSSWHTTVSGQCVHLPGVSVCVLSAWADKGGKQREDKEDDKMVDINEKIKMRKDNKKVHEDEEKQLYLSLYTCSWKAKLSLSELMKTSFYGIEHSLVSVHLNNFYFNYSHPHAELFRLVLHRGFKTQRIEEVKPPPPYTYFQK